MKKIMKFKQWVVRKNGRFVASSWYRDEAMSRALRLLGRNICPIDELTTTLELV